MRLRLLPLLLALALALAGCARSVPVPLPDANAAPQLRETGIRTADGVCLPLQRWGPEDPHRVVLALHGFNDHGGSFDSLARSLAENEIAVYAYDQRGFGATRDPGRWPGHPILAHDARTALELLGERYPDRPPFLLGKSMGAAVSLLALTDGEPPPVAGSVLIAPAVWARGTMPWYQRLGLWLGARTLPRMQVNGDMAARLGIRPTDDPEVMQALRDDPLVRSTARIDTLDGLTTLMTLALEAGDELPPPSLLLYGSEDDIVPPAPVAMLLEDLAAAEAPGHRAVLYPDGFHMLTRYTGAAAVHADIAAWLLDTDAALPSGHERPPAAMARQLRAPTD